jgi:LuxR family maltose regulon positive regulatory protein
VDDVGEARMFGAVDGSTRRRVPRAKIALPQLPSRYVSRPRLLGGLDSAVTTSLIAPAGAGKTLLLAEWAHRRGDVAWVALDSDDNDDGRFWSSVLAALGSCDVVPEGSAARWLPVPERPSDDAAFLADVVAAIADLPSRVRLVLDDIHELTDPAALRGLGVLLADPSARRRLVLAGRRAALPAIALRHAGELAELRAARLRFSAAETRALLAAADVHLSPDQQRELVDWTDGWAAYLGLAAEALRTADEPALLLADLAAHHRPMTEYLVTEVLSLLPTDARDLLRTISVCAEVPADLARVLSGRDDAGDVLAALSRDAFLVTRVGSDRYRLWGPVRCQLSADLARQTPRRAAALHGRAAAWLAPRDPALAVTHASRAGDPRLTARLLRRHAVALTLSGEHATVGRAVDALGDRVVAGDSALALAAALADVSQGAIGSAVRHVRLAETAWPAHPTGETETLLRVARSCLAQATGDVDNLMPTADRLAATASRPVLDTLATMHRGTALLASGHVGTALGRLRDALTEARFRGQDFLASGCLTALAWLAANEGDFRRMTAWAGEADTENTEHGWQTTLNGAVTRILLAYGSMLRAEPVDCVRHIDVAEPVLDTAAPLADHGLGLVAATLRGTAEFGLGDWTAGLHRIRVARAAADLARLAPGQIALCAVLEHRAAALLGQRDAGREVLAWAQEQLPDCAEVLLMRARAQLAMGRHELAGSTVAPALHGDVPDLLRWSVVDAWIVATEVALRTGDHERAVSCLDDAVRAAESMDVLYPLVFAPPDVIGLLAGGSGPAGARTSRVLAARRSLRASPAPVPLTERERAVLSLLPTLHSFDEIAADLTVSVNTVKTHVRAIYTKLGVGRRRDAVLAAVARGLLDTSGDPAGAGDVAP